MVPLRSDTIQMVQNGCSFHGFRSEDPNQHLKDFLKHVDLLDLDSENRKTTRLYVPSTSDRRFIELENQVQRLMEAHLALTQPTQVNKITTSCEIYSGPYNTEYCMEDPEQAFVEYASLRTDEAREGLVSNSMASQDTRLSKFEADFKQQQSEMTNKIDIVLKAITDRIAGTLPNDTQPNEPQNDELEGEDREERSNLKNIDTTLPAPHDPSISFITEKVRKLNSFLESSGWVRQSSDTETVCTKEDDGEVMFIEIFRKNDDSRKEGPEDKGSATIEELKVEYFDTFLTRSELAYHRNEEDKRKGVEYVMSRIMEFYKECLEVGPEYVTGMDDGGEVT
ncbi:hypothetical protein Tco_1074694, partial [Tanacetum coccineum]